MNEEAVVPWRLTAGGLDLSIRVTPRASRTLIAGCDKDVQGRPVLLLRLAAPPVDGAANDALIDFLARELDLRKRDVVVRSGATSRTKTVGLAGDAATMIGRLSALLAADQ